MSEQSKIIICYQIYILSENNKIQTQNINQISEINNTNFQLQNLEQIKESEDAISQTQMQEQTKESEDTDSKTQNLNEIKDSDLKKYPQNQEYKGMFQRFCTLLQIYPPGNSKKMQYFLIEKIVEAILDINSVQNQRLKLLALEYNPNNSHGFINELINMLRFCRNKLQGNVFENLNAQKAAKNTYKKVQKRLDQIAKQSKININCQ